MRHLFLIHLFIFLFCFTASAESIPYEKLVGVWTNSQNGVNHDLTQTQVAGLCGMGFAIFHPDWQSEFHIRLKHEGKLMMSLDVLSKEPHLIKNLRLRRLLRNLQLWKWLLRSLKKQLFTSIEQPENGL
jgi:hypothetical protein